MSVSSGILTRTAVGSGYGAAYAQADDTIGYGTGEITLTVTNPTDAIRFGLTNSGAYSLDPGTFTSPSMTSFSGPTYGFSLASGNLEIWNQEPLPRMFKTYSCNSCVQAGDIYHVFSDEGTVKYYRERSGVLTLLYTTDYNAVKVSYPLLPQVSISSSGSQAIVRVLKPPPFGAMGTIWVSPNGTTYASGADKAHASTLELICNGKRPVNPGETVVLADGTYAGGIKCSPSGTSNSPITFRAESNDSYPPTSIISNSTKVITLELTGNYQIWRDVRIQNTDTTRTSSGQRKDGWVASGNGNQLINSVVNDAVSGIVSQNSGGTYVYGCVTFNNGYTQLSGEGAGHGLYVHNEPQRERIYIMNTVTFNNYKLQMQYYNQINTTETGNMTFDKMVSINGVFGVLGNGPKDNITVSNSHGYRSSLSLGSITMKRITQ